MMLSQTATLITFTRMTIDGYLSAFWLGRIFLDGRHSCVRSRHRGLLGRQKIMAWQSIGHDTLRQGRFTLYKSRQPQEVYWLSVDGRDPVRCETKEAAQELIRQTNGSNK